MIYEEMQLPRRAKDITAQAFSRLTAIAPVGKKKKLAASGNCLRQSGEVEQNQMIERHGTGITGAAS